jgi:hypothetical protein
VNDLARTFSDPIDWKRINTNLTHLVFSFGGEDTLLLNASACAAAMRSALPGATVREFPNESRFSLALKSREGLLRVFEKHAVSTNYMRHFALRCNFSEVVEAIDDTNIYRFVDSSEMLSPVNVPPGQSPSQVVTAADRRS